MPVLRVRDCLYRGYRRGTGELLCAVRRMRCNRASLRKQERCVQDVEQEGRGVSQEVVYARVFPEMDKLKGYLTAQDSVDICSRLWYFMTHEAK